MRSVVIWGLLTFCMVSGAMAQVSDDVIKIGILNDQSGIFADITGIKSVEAAKMAIEDFGGTVLGKRIELVTANHQNKTDIASLISRKWFDDENVDAIADLTGSGVALAVQEVARSRKKVLITASAATSDLYGKACSPTTAQFSYDTYSVAKITGQEMAKQDGKTWFFITADYAYGHAMQREATQFIEAAGGKVVGSVKFPLGTSDYSSFLLQAQGSKAQIIGLATAGADTINTVKQALEFKITGSGQRLGGMIIYINEIDDLGLDVAKGLVFTTTFYWDLNEETRAWTNRFLKRTGGSRPPNLVNAGLYAGILHYLKAIESAKTDDGEAVSKKMRELPVNDFYNKNVRLRQDGRVLHKVYLVEVKDPKESKYKFDYYKILNSVAGEDAYRPEGECMVSSK